MHFGWIAVVSFFYISGFVITRAATRESPAEFAVKRGLRIYPTVIFAVLVVVVLAAIGVLVAQLQAKPSFGETLWAMSLSNWLIPGQPVAMLAVTWTLCIEVMFYIAVLAL